MLALRVHFLTDRFAGCRFDDRTAAEWPPHPSRVYAALVEALHAPTGDSGMDPEEAQALDLLATLGAPRILASGASARRVMTHFVPVNDASQVGVDVSTHEMNVTHAEAACLSAEAALRQADTRAQAKAEARLAKTRVTLASAQRALTQALAVAAAPGSKGGTGDGASRVLPWNRTKQPRTFPAAVPEDPEVAYVWPEATVAPPSLVALNEIASRVVRIGHSSSFARVTFDTTQATNADRRTLHIPDEDGPEVFRVVGEGARLVLEAAHARHNGNEPGRKTPHAVARYRIARDTPAAVASVRAAGRWVVYTLPERNGIPAHAAVQVAEAVRGAILAHAEPPVYPAISGHGVEGPLANEHLAVLPLPFVGHPHADGILRGFALSLPRTAGPDADRALLVALARWESSATQLPRTEAPSAELGFLGGRRCLVERVVDEMDALATLRGERWATRMGTAGRSAATRWATVTPIALDGECSPFHHPDGSVRHKAWRTAEKLIRRAAARMVDGAFDPEDIHVVLNFDAPVVGAAVLRRVPPYQRDGHTRPRRLVHATLSFPRPVEGPLVLGSGRHLGLGLCLPLSSEVV